MEADADLAELAGLLQHQRAEAFLIAVWYAETGGKSVAAPRGKRPTTVAAVLTDALAGIDDEDDFDIPD